MTKQAETKQDTLQLQQLEGPMIKEHHHKVINELYAKGMAKKAIARTLGVDIKTVRRHITKAGWQPYERKKNESASLLKEEQEWLIRRMGEVNHNASILFRELKSKEYKGS